MGVACCCTVDGGTAAAAEPPNAASDAAATTSATFLLLVAGGSSPVARFSFNSTLRALLPGLDFRTAVPALRLSAFQYRSSSRDENRLRGGFAGAAATSSAILHAYSSSLVAPAGLFAGGTDVGASAGAGAGADLAAAAGAGAGTGA